MTMDVLEFSPLYISKLSNDYLFAVSSSTVSKANLYVSALDGVSKAVLAQLVLTTDELKAAIKKAAGSLLTIKITDADNRRDATHTSICRNIKFYLKDDDATKQEAAKVVKHFFDPYWDVNIKPIEVQTQLTFKLISEYKASTTLQENSALIGIDVKFTNLEAQNNEVDQLYNSRTTEKVSEGGESATNIRPDVEKMYEKFCQSLSLAATFTPSDELTQLFGEMDNVRKKYSALLAQSENNDDTQTNEQSGNETT